MNKKLEEKKPVKAKKYTWRDLLKFENRARYSSIGKHIISNVKTAPCYSVGSQNRKSYKKQYFNKELAKERYGRTSKGPKYDPKDEFSYKK